MGNKNSVEEYLNSLPDDVEKIDVSFRNLYYLPNLSRFKKLETLFCNSNNLTSLPVLPKNLKKLYCSDNKLTSLPNLSENLEELYCSNNRLMSLPVLPEKLEKLYCFDNKLTALPVLPENLEELYCSNNELTSLPVLSKNLTELYCRDNNLTSLPVLPEKLKQLVFYGNPIHDIIYKYDSNLNIIKKNTIIWNNFRYLYYCLKYRKRFWKMMEPIIKKRYHPSYLDDLNEEDDLDKKLGAW